MLVFISLNDTYYNFKLFINTYFRSPIAPTTLNTSQPPNKLELLSVSPKDQLGIIFVSIASYRDPELELTVNDMINKADSPHLLRIVIYEQNHTSDKSFIPNHSNIELYKVNHTEAKGPTWARYFIQQKYNNEQYFMQIDSHMRFDIHWDTSLKQMLNRLPNKSVITQYPPNYSTTHQGSEKYSTNLRSGLYIEGFGIIDGFTRIHSNVISNKSQRYPLQSRAWAACFSFSKGEIVKDAPYDPSLPFLFFGEELDITLRLFTRGYNFFSPNFNIVWTKFDRTYRHTFWQDTDQFKRGVIEYISRQRLCSRLNISQVNKQPLLDYLFSDLINVEPDVNYKLGTERSTSDYEKFADIGSLSKRKMKKYAKTFRVKPSRELIR